MFVPLAFALTNCTLQSGEDSERNQQFSTDDVVDHFENETGARLMRRKLSRTYEGLPEWESLTPTNETKAKYGDFSIGVWKDLEDAKEKGLLTGLQADERGIYWEHHPAENEGDDPYWSALKFYRYVDLLWWAPTKQLDTRWRRLDAIVKGLKSSSE